MLHNIESKTIGLMISLFCRKNHGANGLCPECQELTTYALERVAQCPYKENKPVCSKCSVHCYRKEFREKIRRVMRYSGPRMLLYHPILAIHHLYRMITVKN